MRELLDAEPEGSAEIDVAAVPGPNPTQPGVFEHDPAFPHLLDHRIHAIRIPSDNDVREQSEGPGNGHSAVGPNSDARSSGVFGLFWRPH
jgi:hypothetical protein